VGALRCWQQLVRDARRQHAEGRRRELKRATRRELQKLQKLVHPEKVKASISEPAALDGFFMVGNGYRVTNINIKITVPLASRSTWAGGSPATAPS
jgi:hypothetical protein